MSMDSASLMIKDSKSMSTAIGYNNPIELHIFIVSAEV